jgi:hypothetical protein
LVTLLGTQFMIWIKWRKEHEIVSRIGRMNVEEVHFVTCAAVTAVDFLPDLLWWMR